MPVKGEGLMHIALDEAITMHAHMGLAPFGARGAKKGALTIANRRRRKGDDGGAAVWAHLAKEIERANANKGLHPNGDRLSSTQFPSMADHAA